MQHEGNEHTCEDYVRKFPPGVQVKNEDRIKYMFGQVAISDKLEEWINLDQESIDEPQGSKTRNEPTKDAELSVKKREEGNVYFKKREFGKSILSYNDAIKLASFTHGRRNANEVNGNIALCFGNRSAAYCELGTDKDLQNSLSDINYALKYGYPKELKIKIYLRQVNIYLKLGNTRMAREALKQASMCQDIPENLHKRINHLQAQVDSHGSDDKQDTPNPAETNNSLNSFTIASSFRENPAFEGASEHLNIYFSKEKSRYVKCSTALSYGEVVFVEEPFASILIPEFYENYCYHCHRQFQFEYFFPCCSCSQVKFCSEECSETAWETYHQYECGHLGLLQSVGIAHLAFKVLLTAGRDQILEVCSTRNDEDFIRDKTIFHKGQRPYIRVYSLLDHIDAMSPEDMFQYSLTASLLIHFLKSKTNFFDNTSLENIYKIGGVLLKHVCQLICNAHAITCIASDYDSQCLSITTTQESQVRIASAIYPSASMMNHSCDPNIVSSFTNGRALVVRVTSDIANGSQIFNCYGPHVRRMRRSTRQEHLCQQYFFNCDCTACEREAEDGFSFVDTFQALKCSKCSGSLIPDVEKQSFLVGCQDCGRMEDIEIKMRASLQVDQIISVASNLLEEGNTADALKFLLKAYELCTQHLFKFNSDYGHVCDMLGRCYAITGNFSDAIPYVQESLNYVEHRFGETSIELARELRKYCDLLKLCPDADSQVEAINLSMEKSERILNLCCNT